MIPDLPMLAKFALAAAAFVVGIKIKSRNESPSSSVIAAFVVVLLVVGAFHVGFPFFVTSLGYEQANRIGALALFIGFVFGFALRYFGGAKSTSENPNV
jgi:protein-S-isoprenylcysteine O-methyltransferase Ste14